MFGDTVLEVAERNIWEMEIKYFFFHFIVNFITFMNTLS